MSERGFYLGGGTALALHLGHRRSRDLDWFSREPIADAAVLAAELRAGGVPLVAEQLGRGTLHGRVLGVRVSFLEYRYPLLEPPKPWPAYGCAVAALVDLACMKLSAVAQRGSKRDFVDIYALGVAHRPLAELLSAYQRKYGIQDVAHVLYGLIYFDDADRERMPRMLWRVDWRAVKRTIQGWVKEYAALAVRPARP